jgi:hypothetical protein
VASRTIPESLHGELVDLYGEIDPATKKRRGYRELSAWLKAQGIDASREAVRHVVEPLRKERSEIRRDALRDRIAEKLPTQVDALDKLLERMKRDVERGKTTQARARAFNAFRSGVETKLRAAGVGERIELDASVSGDVVTTLVDARAQLAQSLARLTPSAQPEGAGEPSGDAESGDG